MAAWIPTTDKAPAKWPAQFWGALPSTTVVIPPAGPTQWEGWGILIIEAGPVPSGHLYPSTTLYPSTSLQPMED